MASDSAVRSRLVEILREADLNVTTERSIRKQLEEEFGVDLTERKKLIRQEVENYLNRSNQDDKNEEASGGYDDDIDENGHEAIDDEKKVSKKRKAKETKVKETKQAKTEKKKSSSGGGGAGGGGSGGLKQVCRLSPQLASIVGYPELPRTQVVKEVWRYIREKGLQDPSNKRRIICDDEMRSLFGTDSTDMFHMNKLLSSHIFRIPQPIAEETDQSVQKKPISENNAFSAPQPLSTQLQQFLGGVKMLPRPQVVKRMWQYIKENDLQDPENKKNILCDAKLQKLLGVSSFNGFGMAKVLAPHFLKHSDIKPPSQVTSQAPGKHHERDKNEDEGEDKEDEEQEEEENVVEDEDSFED